MATLAGESVPRILRKAVADRVFPGAVVEMGNATQPLWTEVAGHFTYDPEAPPTTADTIFDLASLTKVLSTTMLAMQQVERGAIGLDDLVGRHIERWTPDAAAAVTVRDLLAHCAGLAAWKPFYLNQQGREAFEAAICSTPLEYQPRSKSIYSDLGFMLLGFALGSDLSLAARYDALLEQLGGAPEIQFNPPKSWRARTAPTEDDPWRGRLLVGEVHDDNAWALGGIAGHAGLFGTAAAVGHHARHLLQVLRGRSGVIRRDTLERFVRRRTDIPGSSRALGWDTALPTSSCGTRMSPTSFGHTGFTGTSLWIDPVRALYVVLLSNRVHPTRRNGAITAVRRAVHDAVFEAL